MRFILALAMLAATPVVLVLCLFFWLVGIVGIAIGTHEVKMVDGAVSVDRK